MKRIYIGIMLAFAISYTACNKQQEPISLSQRSDSSEEQITNDMNSFISIFEIPATDFERATQFYESILDVSIDEIDMQGTQMGIFPSKGQAVSGVIVKGADYQPSGQGVLIYFNGGADLQVILDKIKLHGGQTIVPKTLIDAENGYFALFLDTEGNRLGLHSQG